MLKSIILNNFQEVLDIKTSLIQIQIWIDFYQEVSNNIQNRKLIEYVEFRNFDTFEKVEKVSKNTLVAIAVRVGKTRLIDNIIL